MRDISYDETYRHLKIGIIPVDLQEKPYPEMHTANEPPWDSFGPVPYFVPGVIVLVVQMKPLMCLDWAKSRRTAAPRSDVCICGVFHGAWS